MRRWQREHVLGWLVSLVCALGWTGCSRLPAGPAVTSRSTARGITFVDWSASGYASPAAARSLSDLAATGANTVVIVVTAYQADRFASELRPLDPRTPTPGAVRRATENAAALGLEVVLKPHVDVDGGIWRGRIEPRDPVRWFESYRRFVLPWAALADSAGSREFVAGTELAGTLEHADLWRETIHALRGAFRGRLVYAASWDESERVPFWSDLDRVGVDFYFPVSSRRDAGRFEILAGWQPWLERLHRLHERTHRPILITEVGYPSLDGAGMHPYEMGSGNRLDLGEQADLYWAALQATGDLPWCAGLYWWDWPADGSGGARDPGYSPIGKPAARELSTAWSR